MYYSRSNCNSEVIINNSNLEYDTKFVLIKQANTAIITSIFKLYGINVDEYNRKCICPLPNHRETGASFYFYKDTNSFYCFGCKVGGGPVELVSALEEIEKFTAAQKIHSKFETENIDYKPNIEFFEKQKILLNFSSYIRSYIHINECNNLIIENAEKIALIFDTITAKRIIDNNGLKMLIEKLQKKLV